MIIRNKNLETKKQTKQKEKARTRYKNEKQKGRKQENNTRETKRKKVKEEQAQKRLTRNKGRHRKLHKKCPFWGENRVFIAKTKTMKQKNKKNKIRRVQGHLT